jgi:nucleoside-diphosphate-sugar epimerase
VTNAVLLTGGTGLVGSNIALRLLRGGRRVVFLLRGPEAEARGRLDRAFRVIDPRCALARGADIASGDLTRDGCGLDADTVRRLDAGVSEIWNCAGVFSFDEARADETRAVNVAGTRRLLALADALGRVPLHHVSTAYVAGARRDRAVEGAFDDRVPPQNPYEASKREAEALIRRWGGPFTLYRPSVIVGDSRTGRTVSFSGYYRMIQFFVMLKAAMVRRLRNGRSPYEGSGIRLLSGDDLRLPVHIPVTARATLNLTPIDWVADTALAVAAAAPPGGATYHLTHPRPAALRGLLRASGSLLGIYGAQVDTPERFRTAMAALDRPHPELRRTQELILKSLHLYMPYLAGEPRFDTARLRAALGPAYRPPPDITPALLDRLVGYARRVNFGAANGNHARLGRRPPPPRATGAGDCL